jgi:tRNA pseudouridine55 synthase
MVVSIVNGLLSLDKPSGISSYDLIHQVKQLFPHTKIGHSGTLDPLASGLLILGIGNATRALTQLLKLDKHYLATFRLGFATDTDDAEGNVTEIIDEVDRLIDLDSVRVKRLLAGMVGPQLQIPPPFSAKKIRGRRAYELARAGEKVILKPSPIEIYGLQLLGLGEIAGQGQERGNDLLFRDLIVDIHCSSGTYVRSLARDFGLLAGVPGHVACLRRTQIGPYTVANAQRLESFSLSDIVPERSFLQPLTAYSRSRDPR